MKKFIVGSVLSSFLFLLTAVSPAVAQSIQVGIVEGLIFSGGSAADGASVGVTCNGVTVNTTADSSGFYFAQFGNGVCTAGMTATVFASKNGQSGSNTGVLTNQGAISGLTLDVAIIHVPLVPEFGLVTGIGTLLLSTASFSFLRKRKTV